jgi:hypothetical protein
MSGKDERAMGCLPRPCFPTYRSLHGARTTHHIDMICNAQPLLAHTPSETSPYERVPHALRYPWKCSWHGIEHLGEMMHSQRKWKRGGSYNEVVVDGRNWTAQSVEAVFEVRRRIGAARSGQPTHISRACPVVHTRFHQSSRCTDTHTSSY